MLVPKDGFDQRTCYWTSPATSLTNTSSATITLFFLQGGEPDINTVARMVLNDFQRGKLPYFVKPPATAAQEVTVSDIFVVHTLLNSKGSCFYAL